MASSKTSIVQSMSPLDGITVLDLTRVLSGPYCTMMLGRHGRARHQDRAAGQAATTRAHWGRRFSTARARISSASTATRKASRSTSSTPAGRAHPRSACIAKSDVLVENFRPGTLAKLGLDYATLAPAHPRLVYCSISGFGQTGPRRQEPGYDAVMQARRRVDEHHRRAPMARRIALGVAIADIVTGMFAAQGITVGAARARADGTRPGGRHRDARLGRGAAHLPGGHLLRDRRSRRRGWATAIRRSCRTRRSRRPTASSCSPSATTISGGASARSPASTPTSGSPPTAQRVTQLRRAAADARRAAATRSRAATGSSGSRPPACRADRSAICTRCSPIRRWRRATWSPTLEHADAARSRLLGTPIKLSDTPAAHPHGAADARRAHGRGAAHAISA